MTEKLRALLDERASAPAFDLPDLDAVRSAGLRRRRRAYAGATAGGVVATAAAATLVLGLVAGGDGSADPTPVAVDPPTTAPLEVSWATGSVIHLGDRDVETGRPVRVYGRTSLGFVIVDAQDRMWSVADETVRQLGTVGGDSPELLSDPTSSYVAWLDGTGGLAVHDLVTDDSTQVDLPDGGSEGVELLASDGDLAYVRAGSQVVQVDLTSGGQRVVRTVEEVFDGLDAAAGRTAAVTWGTTGALAEVGPAAGPPDSRFEAEGGEPLLSPGATYLALGQDEGPVYDAATGRRVPLDLRGYYEPYEWWDDTTVAVVTETRPGSERARLASCDVVSGVCRTEVADLGPFDDLEDFSLPVGDR